MRPRYSRYTALRATLIALFFALNATVSAEEPAARMIQPQPPRIVKIAAVGGLAEPANQIAAARFREFSLGIGEFGPVASAAGGKRLFAANDKTIFQITPTAAGALELKKLVELPSTVSALNVSPDNRWLAVGEFSRVTLVSVASGERVHTLTQVEGRVTAMAWNAKSDLLAIGRADGDVFVWHVATGQDAGEDTKDALETYSAAHSPIVKIVFHPDGRAFFVAEHDGVIRLWRLIQTEIAMGVRDQASVSEQQQVGRKYLVALSAGVPIEDMTLAPDGNTIYVSVDNRVLNVKVRGLVLQNPWTVGPDSARRLQLLTGTASSAIAVTGKQQRVRFLCAGNGREVAVSPVFEDQIDALLGSGASTPLWLVQKTGSLIAFEAQSLAGFPSCP